MGKETEKQATATEESNVEKGEPNNLWNQILSEASRTTIDRLESRTIIVLGDRNSGKTTLIAKLQGIDVADAGKGIALDYSYIDIHSGVEHDDEPVARVNVWQLEGEEDHKNLLGFALNPSTIPNALALLVIDFSQPWNLVASLNRWLNILENHLREQFKKMPIGVVDELKNYAIYDFQQYAEPTAAPPNTHAPKVVRKKKHVDEQSLLPRGEEVLSNQLGIPILVVCTKSDTTLQLTKEYGYKDDHFDYIHQYIRKICLKYGASLIYVSAKRDRNCDVLMDYVKHKLYGFDFYVKPSLEKDSLFFPAGYDSIKKINTDFKHQSLTRDPEEPYEDVIKIPKILELQAEEQEEPFVTAEDDQDFLTRQKEVIDRTPATPTARDAIPGITRPAPSSRDQPTSPSATPVITTTTTPTSTGTGSRGPPPSLANLRTNSTQAIAEMLERVIKQEGPVAPLPNLPQIPPRNPDASPRGSTAPTPTMPRSTLSPQQSGSPNANLTSLDRDDIASKLAKLRGTTGTKQ